MNVGNQSGLIQTGDKAFDFTVNGQFNTATLTFKYDSSSGTIGDDFQPRIYHFNEKEEIFEIVDN